MLVFKFGGASVKSAEAVRNIASILQRYREEKIVVVVSAMGKTTNALERIIEAFAGGNRETLEKEYQQLKEYHEGIAEGLFGEKSHPVHMAVKDLMDNLAERLTREPTLNYDFDYDQLICYGELLSTTIISHYLNKAGAKRGSTGSLPDAWPAGILSLTAKGS